MATKLKAKENVKTMRVTPEDSAILKRLQKKLGVGYSQIVKIALRKLAESEGVAA